MNNNTCKLTIRVVKSESMRNVEELTDLYRSNGRKMTPQRQCIFRVLKDNVAHPSAEDVYKVARDEMETISLKTVYQTLNELAELGEISALDVGTGVIRFDPNIEEPHHHLVCKMCGKIRDLKVDLGSFSISNSMKQGYEIASVEVIFRGQCSDCRRKGSSHYDTTLS